MTNEIKEDETYLIDCLKSHKINFDYCLNELLDYINNLQQRIDKAVRKAQLIVDIGFDYDGYNDTKNLKKIIDEFVKYAVDIKDILRGDE